MKILIIGRPRTRSTLLINTLSNFYKLSDRDEHYKYILGKLNNNLNGIDYAKSHIKTFTQKLFSEDNFVIKLFPRMSITSPYKISDLKSYQLSIINDLSYFYNLKKYDKIFFIDRELVESVYSYAYSNHINIFNFRDQKILNEYSKNREPVFIDFKSKDHLRFCVLEKAILDVWYNSLLELNIKFTTLGYNDIPKFISDNYPNIITSTLNNTFNYKTLISNYDECSSHILEFYDECKTFTKRLTFV